MSYIRFDKVNKFFGTNHVLKDISIEIEEGQLVTFLGPSGCGKSTLLRCLSGLEQASSGRIYLGGEDITDLPPQKRGIGLVFQQYSLFPNMTVEKNIAFGLRVARMSKPEIEKKVDRVLEIVGLTEKKKHYPRQLSGGQQQRVALARALVMEPKVLLLDEPLSAIDALLRRNLQIEIRRIQQELKITTLFVTHDQDEAIVMSDHIFLFNMGQIEQADKAMDLYTGPKTHFAAKFIGNYNILSKEDYRKLFGTEAAKNGVAIRPEVIKVSTEPQQGDGYTFTGVVRNFIPHGNIIRYGVEVNGVMLNVDKLHDDVMLPCNGSNVYLHIKRENVLDID
ncbi:MAG: ABC transporter ATP-binding protein [Clostridia bacterium]|nr:ABC transporter ATP-binding protein [Clostridia bacterium]